MCLIHSGSRSQPQPAGTALEALLRAAGDALIHADGKPFRLNFGYVRQAGYFIASHGELREKAGAAKARFDPGFTV